MSVETKITYNFNTWKQLICHSNIHINIQTTYQHTHQHTDSNIYTQAGTGCGQPANRCTPVPLPSRLPPGCTGVQVEEDVPIRSAGGLRHQPETVIDCNICFVTKGCKTQQKYIVNNSEFEWCDLISRATQRSFTPFALWLFTSKTPLGRQTERVRGWAFQLRNCDGFLRKTPWPF